MIVKNIIKSVVYGLIPLLLVTSCGNQNTAQPGDTILINPPDVEAGYPFDGTCPPASGYPPTIHADIQPIKISIFSSSGALIRGVDIEVGLTFTGSTSADEIMWLFDDEEGDGNGLIKDAGSPSGFQDAELVSSNTSPISYKTNTGSSGTKTLVLLSDGNCPFTGYLRVFSGSVANNIDISFNQ